MTWPTFQLSRAIILRLPVPSKPITTLSIIYGGARPEQLAVPRWANSKMILELLVLRPTTVALPFIPVCDWRSAEALRENLGFFGHSKPVLGLRRHVFVFSCFPGSTVSLSKYSSQEQAPFTNMADWSQISVTNPSVAWNCDGCTLVLFSANYCRPQAQ